MPTWGRGQKARAFHHMVIKAVGEGRKEAAADLLGNGLGRDGVVPRHHDHLHTSNNGQKDVMNPHLDTSAPAAGHSVGHGGLGRVDQAVDGRRGGAA